MQSVMWLYGGSPRKPSRKKKKIAANRKVQRAPTKLYPVNAQKLAKSLQVRKHLTKKIHSKKIYCKYTILLSANALTVSTHKRVKGG